MSEGDGMSSSFSDGAEVNAAMENYQKLPAVVKRRVRALKKLQFETVKLTAAFYKDLLELEIKHDADHQRLFEVRKSIITGEKEPADDECDWPSDAEPPSAEGDEIEKLCDDVGNKAKFDEDCLKDGSDAKGIPEFWLQTMRSVPLLAEIIQDNDVDVLKHLVDIKCVLHSDEPGYTLEFHFNSNPYFVNKILTKRYYFNCNIPTDDPFSYDGPEVCRTKGCAINWNPGKNVTVKILKKTQKRKGTGQKRTVTKTVQADSFFNFFDPPTQTLSDDLEEDMQMLLEADFKLGHLIRHDLIPKAVLFFTGEAVVSDSDDDEEDDDDEDEDTDDDDEEEDSAPHNTGHRQQRHKASESSATGEQPECKQQ